MTLVQNSLPASDEIILLVFNLTETFCGIDVRMVQEVNKHFDVTFVPLASEFVRGVLNLRGQIVTVVDLARKLGLEGGEGTEEQRNIIVEFENELYGLVVDRVRYVIEVGSEIIEDPPANIGSVRGKYFKGVVKAENSLIGILNMEEVLNF